MDGYGDVKFLCEQCKAKYQIADDKIVGRTVRMKCRKCGHLIEMRAAVTGSSASTAPPPAAPPSGPGPSSSSQAKPPPKPPAPRATPLAASLTAPRPAAPKPERLPGALAGAFRSNVQREEEGSAPFDMAELAPGNDWYVAIGGVPVGPVRVSEIRRKATMGAVTEESLVWQEGLDEWRPLRTFPELAAIVREALGGARSLPSPVVNAPQRGNSVLPSAPTNPQRIAPQRMASSAIAAPRSNVVAITSRLATAERLDEPAPVALDVAPTSAQVPPVESHPVVVADPFAAMAPASLAGAAVAVGPATGAGPRAISPEEIARAATAVAVAAAVAAEVAPARAQRGPPLWILLVLLVIAAAFGITAAMALFIHRAPAPAPVIVQVPAPVATPQATAPVTAPLAPSSAGLDVAPIVVAATSAAPRTGASGPAKSAPAPSASGRTLDLHGIGTGPSLAAADDPNDGPKAAGQCMSEGQVQQVIGLHQVGIRRSCWERSSTVKGAVNISVALTIGPDGTSQSTSASGDDPSVAKCVENDVRGWHFPAMGCSQKTGFSFKFVRQ